MGPSAVAMRQSPAVLSNCQSQGVGALLPGLQCGVRAISLL